MLAVHFDALGSPARKRSLSGLLEGSTTNEPSDACPTPFKRIRKLGEENPQSPNGLNRMLFMQRDNELKEMRLQLEMKEMEIHNRDQKIQELQNHISAASSKVQQFDSLAKCFMDQNQKLKQKEEEVSSLTTVIQKLLAENKTLKNQLYLLDRESMVRFLSD
ncbi:hypothetical protein WA556_000746 [Blastocystis sp. ATCC 50177/Nand II]